MQNTQPTIGTQSGTTFFQIWMCCSIYIVIQLPLMVKILFICTLLLFLPQGLLEDKGTSAQELHVTYLQAKTVFLPKGAFPWGWHLANQCRNGITSAVLLLFPTTSFLFPAGSTHSIRCFLWGKLPSCQLKFWFCICRESSDCGTARGWIFIITPQLCSGHEMLTEEDEQGLRTWPAGAWSSTRMHQPNCLAPVRGSCVAWWI